MNRTEWAVWTVFAAVIAFTLTLAVVGTINNGQEFREECVALGGKPVHSGREHVCLR